MNLIIETMKEKEGTFKVKCIGSPKDSCTYRFVTIGNIYVGLWRDADDIKLKKDDRGNEGYYYNADLFEMMPFETEPTVQNPLKV